MYTNSVSWVCLSFLVVFPQDLLENGLEANNFAMLGLGDIVIPGIFIALLLRYDVRCVCNLFGILPTLSAIHKTLLSLAVKV